MTPAARAAGWLRVMPGVFVLIWATGFIVARYGMPYAPPRKFLVCASLLVLVHLQRADVFVALIIIGREIAISALREWMARIGAGKSVAVHMIGKVKTTVQMVAIPFLLYDGSLFKVIDTGLWGQWLIWISAVLTVCSMVYYLQKAIPEIRAHSK